MNGFEFPLEVVRSGRRKRSVSFEVRDERVTVRVPKRLSEKHLREFIVKRTPWIIAKLKEARERPPIKPKEYVNGEAFPYLGHDYRLKIDTSDEKSAELRDGYLRISLLRTDPKPRETAQRLLESWYKDQVSTYLKEKVALFAKVIGVNPKSITVKSYKSRWGSCSPKGDLSFNWRLVFMPHPIIDYVVVHELCHMLELNHSKRFWQHVEHHIPDHRARRTALKQHQTPI